MSYEWDDAYARQRFTEALVKALDDAAIELQGNIKDKVNQFRSPPPSVEGSPPHNLTGALFRGIEVDRSGLRQTHPSVVVGVSKAIDYAMRLEFGFRGVDKRGRMISQGPRPYFRPTVAVFQKEFMATLPNRIKRFIEG